MASSIALRLVDRLITKKNLPDAGGSPLKVRPFHCTSIELTLAITLNVGNSSV